VFDVAADAEDLDLVLGELVLVDPFPGFVHGRPRADGDVLVLVDLPGDRERHLVDLLLGVILDLFLRYARFGHEGRNDLLVTRHLRFLSSICR